MLLTILTLGLDPHNIMSYGQPFVSHLQVSHQIADKILQKGHDLFLGASIVGE